MFFLKILSKTAIGIFLLAAKFIAYWNNAPKQ